MTPTSSPSTPRPPSRGLVGLYYSTFTEDGKHVIGTGKIIGQPQAGYYLVELHARGTAVVTHIRLVPYTDMFSWHFYRTEEAMANACGSLPSLVPAPLPGKESQGPYTWRVEVNYTRSPGGPKKRAMMHIIADDEREVIKRVYERLADEHVTTLDIPSIKKFDPGQPVDNRRYWNVMVREFQSEDKHEVRDRLYHVVAETAGKAMALGVNRSMATHSAYARTVLWLASVAQEKLEEPLKSYEVCDWNIHIIRYHESSVATELLPYRVIASSREAAIDEAWRRASMVYDMNAGGFLEVKSVERIPDTSHSLRYTPIK